MNRWLVAALITLALILLLSPGIVGRLAERNIEGSLARVDLENENLSIEAQRFERGWFTSEGRHRIELTGGPFAAAQRRDGAGAPAVIVNTRVDHGLVPLTSMRRDGGSVNPALATAVSTLTFERGDGDHLDFPGRIYTLVGLTGATTYRFLLEPGEDVAGNARTSWQSADLELTLSANGRERTLAGTIGGPVIVEAFDVVTRIGPISIDSESDRRRHPLGEGRLEFRLGSLEMSGPDAQGLVLGPISIDSRTALDDGRVGGDIAFRLTAERAVDGEPLDLRFVLDFAGFDADRAKLAVDALRASLTESFGAQSSAPRTAPDVELFRLIAAGGSAELKDLDVELAGGSWQMNATLDVEAVPGVTSPEDWASVLLRTTARLDATLAAALFDRMAETNPDLHSMVAGGFLRRRGDVYEIEAELDAGRVTVNGAPVADIATLFGAPR